MMKQRFPLLVFRRTAEANRVIFQCSPSYQQNVPVGCFDTALEFVIQIPVHAGDDSPGFCERGFELGFIAQNYIQHRNFEHGIGHDYTPCTKS